MAVRHVKVLLVMSVGLYLGIVAFDNLVDYRTNFEFVSHVLRMDTTFSGGHTKWRAITNPGLHHAAYVSVITWEALSSMLCFAGAWKLFRRVRESAARFNESKNLATVGLAASFLLWTLAFITVGGEWFMMWQSSQWNGEGAAERLFSMTGIVLLFLSMPDEDFSF